LVEAKEYLGRLLESAIGKISDRRLVRARLVGPNIKSVDSLRLKAERENWKDQDAISACPDMIRARLVCNNYEDVYRLVELIKEMVPFGEPEPEIQDYVKRPQDSGYRAVHVNFRLEAGGLREGFLRLGCEIQIRTLLQDAWSELSHEDITKAPKVYPTWTKEI
jgi:putative GTP pyrophosphokinase